MRIALAQQNYTVGDIDGNTLKIIEAIERAKREGVELIIFPEQAISGLPAFDLLRKSTFLELCEDALVQIASICDGITALVGLPILTSKGTVSAAALIHDRQVLRYIGKKKITARREMGFLVEGHGVESVTIAGHRFAVAVGDDVRNIQDLDPSVETILSLNARKYNKGALTYRLEILRERAMVLRRNVVCVNLVGGATDLIYDGSSLIFNSRGELTLFMKNFSEDFAVYNLDDDNGGIKLATVVSYNDRVRLLYKAAVMGIKDYFAKNNLDKACVGLSGGVDSALVATLAVSALGAHRVTGVMMPSAFTSSESIRDAEQLIKNLGIESKVLPIKDSYKAITESVAQIIGGTEQDETEENIQARIRMITLAALHDKHGYAVLNTSNKSENALGLCTLYGDTAGAFCVVGDLYKSEVYDLARYINKNYGNPIPEEILAKEPTSELSVGGGKRGGLPSYEVVDAILHRMIELEQHREEIVNAGFESDVVEKIHSMIMSSEKKRFQYPPVLRLSAYSFKHERLMPLTHNYGDN
ncbi:MAG: NAD(+) synthase [Rikenellaceae bacterium]